MRDAAVCISQLTTSSDKSTVDRLCDKSTAILDYIQRYPAQLSADSGSGVALGRALADIPWARRATARPKFYPSLLPWYADQTPFYRPAEMTRRGLASAVGSVQPVTVADVSDLVQQAFGWDQPPPVRRFHYRPRSTCDNTFGSVRPSVFSVGALLFEPFDI